MTSIAPTIIVACTRDFAIGRSGDLLYHISDDLKRFKALTMGHPIIMGRRTFESFPKGALPGRRNIVVTRNPAYTAQGIETATSLDDALALCGGDSPNPYIIGGGEVYRQALPLAERIELTLIDALAPDADTHFPLLTSSEWKIQDDDNGDRPFEIESLEWQHSDPRSCVGYTFLTLTRV